MTNDKEMLGIRVRSWVGGEKRRQYSLYIYI